MNQENWSKGDESSQLIKPSVPAFKLKSLLNLIKLEMN